MSSLGGAESPHLYARIGPAPECFPADVVPRSQIAGASRQPGIRRDGATDLRAAFLNPEAKGKEGVTDQSEDPRNQISRIGPWSEGAQEGGTGNPQAGLFLQIAQTSTTTTGQLSGSPALGRRKAALTTDGHCDHGWPRERDSWACANRRSNPLRCRTTTAPQPDTEPASRPMIQLRRDGHAYI